MSKFKPGKYVVADRSYSVSLPHQLGLFLSAALRNLLVSLMMAHSGLNFDMILTRDLAALTD